MRIYPVMVALVFAIMSFTPLAFSQTLQYPGLQGAPGYTEAELKSFATAAVQVIRIHESYLPRIHGATSADEQQQLQQTASGAMTQAVELQGLSVAKYNEILQQVKTDPTVAERVRAHLGQ